MRLKEPVLLTTCSRPFAGVQRSSNQPCAHLAPMKRVSSFFLSFYFQENFFKNASFNWSIEHRPFPVWAVTSRCKTYCNIIKSSAILGDSKPLI